MVQEDIRSDNVSHTLRESRLGLFSKRAAFRVIACLRFRLAATVIGDVKVKPLFNGSHSSTPSKDIVERNGVPPSLNDKEALTNEIREAADLRTLISVAYSATTPAK